MRKIEEEKKKEIGEEEIREEFLKFSDQLIKNAKDQIAEDFPNEFIISSAIQVGEFICGLNYRLEN